MGQAICKAEVGSIAETYIFVDTCMLNMTATDKIGVYLESS